MAWATRSSSCYACRMVRLRVAVALAFALAGCASHGAPPQAWPKASTTALDGGESLAPHESKQIVVAVEKSDEGEHAAAAPAAAVPTAAAPADAPPAASPAAVTPTEETITSEGNMEKH